MSADTDYPLLPFQHWYDDKLKWHRAVITFSENVSDMKYAEILQWVYENVDNPLRHSRWRLIENCVEILFRYERDCILFTLRWL